MPLLSDSYENDQLAEGLQDTLLYARSITAKGSRFGALSIAAQLMPVYLFDHPGLAALGDGATDGCTVLLNARRFGEARFGEALEEGRSGPSQRDGALGLVLGGLAQACAVAMGEALDDAMPVGLMSLPKGGESEPGAAALGARVGVISTPRLLQVILEAGEDGAAEVIAKASSQFRAERLRSGLAERLSEPESEADAAVARVLKERGVLTGALSELGWGGRVEAGPAPAKALMDQACGAWEAREEGRQIAGALEGGEGGGGEPAPRRSRSRRV